MDKNFHCEHVLDDKGQVMETLLVFSFTTKEVLNSNALPSNTFYLSTLKKFLRSISSENGSSWHLHPFYSKMSCEYKDILNEKSLAKSRATKKMNKDNVSIIEQLEVIDAINYDFEDSLSELESFMSVQDELYLYDKCHISVGVSAPTKRIFDPPNFYPTIKPIIDGLTDALWWEDDNFHYITSTEFHYNEPNKSKKYKFYINIKRVA